MPAPTSPGNSQGSSRWIFVLAVLFLLLGVGGVVFGARSYLRERTFLAHAVHTTGTVTDVVTSRDTKRHVDIYKPDFAFTDAAGNNWENFSAANDDQPYHIGDSLPIAYDPDNPAEAQILAYWQNWGAATVATPLGLILAGLSSIFVGAFLPGNRAKNARDTPPRDPAILEAP